MSLAHELTLDSQVELLERLQLLTRYSSNFVNVAGSKGAGKSWLAQRFLEHWAEDKNQSLLMCHPNQDDEQRRTTILNQLVSDPLFNPKDSLSDSFSALFADSSCDVVIVVDDAHLLSDVLLSELWMWLLEAQSHPLWRVNVVLFSLPSRLDTLLTRLSYGQELKPVDLEIESLSQPEADRLFEQRVMRYVDDDRERQVRQAFKKVKRLPGDIMALAEQKMEKRIVIRSIIGSPLNIALLVILLLLLIGGGYWWMWSQPSADETAQQLTQGIEQTAIPTLESNEQVRMDDVAAEAADNRTRADDDSSALPPAVIESSEGVGKADGDQQRVVITSDVVDALLDDKAAVPAQSQSQPQASADAAPQNSAAAAESETNDQAAGAENSAAEAGQSDRPVRFSFGRDELNAMSPRSYTLQLAAVNSLPEVQRFIDQYQLQGEVNVYPTVRNDTEWYIITYRNYATIQLARDAVETLPQPLQSLGPWAKSLSQVQREIARGQ
ncbi:MULTISPECIES: SPOR domain-containing protein [Vibrio]|uniref:SPOR domain-containing protein n=1 Tax=Vibrio ostreae TaxID=2841925 RepID=A0A975U9E1_9VIBR|nr:MULTISPECIES: AAA family ATPase [Vibrio]QXO17634.1 SPOR domain-containing protein [Vibrio ostreae]WGY48052.1 SPOR domain-containing protein [Vibrio sp. ABG19]